MQLQDATPSPCATLYHSDFSIDAIPPHPNVSPEQHQLYQSWVGSLNWLAIFTRLDLTTAINFLSTFITVHHCNNNGRKITLVTAYR
eukprot:5805459-Ditylum_brightwellii.AAC.1